MLLNRRSLITAYIAISHSIKAKKDKSSNFILFPEAREEKTEKLFKRGCYLCIE
jgi:hypothetical protein